MSYKIRYGPTKKDNAAIRKGRVLLLTLCFFILFLAIAWHCLPSQLEALRQTLLPTQMIDDLLENLRQDGDVFQAVGAFWQEIKDGA